MAQLTIGKKVLVKSLSLAYSDYRNLAGEVVEVHGDFASVAIPRNKISVEDLRDLKKDQDCAIVHVKLSSLA